MASTDTMLVKKTITQTIPGVGSTTTKGVEEEQSIGTVMTGATATTTQEGAVRQMTFTAQQSPDFASLAAVTVAYNALLTKLIAAKQMAAS